MPLVAVNGAMCKCSFGLAPSSLVVPPVNCVYASNLPAANIMDCKPCFNIMPFGMCTSMANPTVAAATAAALGVLTPMPCVPVIAGTWTPIAPTAIVKSAPVLVQGAVCMCAYAGVINVTVPGQTAVST